MSTNSFLQGDVVWVTLNPRTGHEQAGRRPALVVSSGDFNRYNTVVWICPITHTNRNCPDHIKIPDGEIVDGFIMCNQLRSVDFTARNCTLIGQMDKETVIQCLAVIGEILDN